MGRRPKALESKESEKKLLDVITDRGRYLVTIDLPKNKDVGRLTLLYFKVVERFRPTDKNVILGLMKLKMQGIEGELADLLKAPIGLRPVPSPRRPSRPRRPNPNRVQREMCRARLWRDLGLAKSPGNGCASPKSATNCHPKSSFSWWRRN